MRRIVFLDFDGTLLPEKNNLFWHFVRTLPDPTLRAQKTQAFVSSMASLIAAASLRLIDKPTMYRAMLRAIFENLPVELSDLTSELLAEQIESKLYPRMREVLAQHRSDATYLVTANSEPIVSGFCERRGMRCLATRLVIEGDRYTGEVEGELNQGDEKVARIERLLLPELPSMAYGNSADDLRMLHSVDEPVLVNPDRRLTRDSELMWARRIYAQPTRRAKRELRASGGLNADLSR
jgi:HAD superfamily phosphoserine phosphatase-like hydrolase